jgi:hypothetical protein
MDQIEPFHPHAKSTLKKCPPGAHWGCGNGFFFSVVRTMDLESRLFVAEDLEFLASWGSEIQDGDIRRGSATLRRLLVEETYGTAWRAAGFDREPTLIAVDIHNLFARSESHKVALALAAGAHFRGLQIAGFLDNAGSSALSAPNDSIIRPDGYPGERVFNLSEFVRSPSGYVDGESFSRKDVIKYIANVKGGVHLNPKQRKQEEKLVARLGKIDRKIMVNTTDGLLVELVAIAQAIGSSEDAKNFILRARS